MTRRPLLAVLSQPARRARLALPRPTSAVTGRPGGTGIGTCTPASGPAVAARADDHVPPAPDINLDTDDGLGEDVDAYVLPHGPALTPGVAVRHDHCLALHAPLRPATVRPPTLRPAMAFPSAPSAPAPALVRPSLTARAAASPTPTLHCLPLTARARARLAPALDCLPLTAVPGSFLARSCLPVTSRLLAARPRARAVRAGTSVVDLDRLRHGRLRRVIDVVADQHGRPQDRAREDERYGDDGDQDPARRLPRLP